MGVAKAAQTWARRLGVEIARYPTYLSHEFQLRAAIKDQDVDLVIDVGACGGSFVKDLRSIGYTGEVVSFEPVASSCERLRMAARFDPLWTVHQVALGASAGELNLYVHNDQPWLNSARRTTEYGRRHFGIDDCFSETVLLDTLDGFIDRVGLNLEGRRVFLKVDTQGLDFEVLSGARQALSFVRVLQVEVAAGAFYERTPPFGESLDRLMTLGFDIADLSAVARDGVRVVEFDCLMVKARG